MSDWLRSPLVQALLTSAVLHAVLLIGVLPSFPARMEAAATRLEAVLNTSVSARPTAMPLPKMATPAVHAVRPSAPSLLKTIPAASTVLAVPGAAAEVVAQPPLLPAAATASRVAGDVGGTQSGASAPASQGLSADDLRQYRLSLAIAARRFKRYPALARERGWEGTSAVAINQIAALPTPQIALLDSSGRTALDEQAVEMVTQAARVTELPEALKGRNFRVVLPVKFSLEE